MILGQKKTHALFPWILVLSIALLCTQGVKLHVHGLGHDHDPRHSHTCPKAVEHSHLSKPHLSTDLSHDDYHDELVSELDANPNGLLKKVSSTVLTLALFAMVLMLLLSGFNPLISHRRRDNGVNLSWRYLRSPPLRAPPL